MGSVKQVRRVRRLSRAWRWPLGGLVASAVGALFVPIGVLLWLHLCVAVSAVFTLVRLAHREIPLPIAVAQWRLGGDHPEVLRARTMSAAMALQRGQVGLAVYRLERALPDLVRVLGPDHPDTLSARSLNLQMRGEHGGLPDRLAAMEDLIGDLTRVLGPGHPDTLAARYCRAEWLSQDGRTDEAETAFADVVTTATGNVGPDSDITLVARSSLTILRHERSDATPADAAAAVDELAAVVDDMERALGAGNPTAASTRRLLDQWRSTRPDPMLPPVD
ncbi:tetratricopeptide repeat protein [Streptomyces sp. NPDC058751]|uniref:tetratricopeptide repeat protein n=1 Tax=Streptomyces sp. NPDC058751 TaxID=3346623 RepID=UPI003681F4B1